MNIGLLIYDLRSGGAERVLCKWSDLLIQENRVFLLYRKVLLWRTLDIKVARTEAGIANKR